jgi:hypothetical protein
MSVISFGISVSPRVDGQFRRSNGGLNHWLLRGLLVESKTVKKNSNHALNIVVRGFPFHSLTNKSHSFIQSFSMRAKSFQSFQVDNCGSVMGSCSKIWQSTSCAVLFIGS